MQSIGEWWMWAGFVGFVLIMLALDLYAFGGKKAHKVPVREALAWSILWVTLAVAFSALLWWYLDGQAGREVANAKATEFLTGYLIEKSLSMDNVFVFVMIFGYFAVSPEYQRRVLLYGVLGQPANRVRLLAVLQRFHKRVGTSFCTGTARNQMTTTDIRDDRENVSARSRT